MKKSSIIIPLLLFFSLSNAQLLAENDKQKHYVAGALIGGITYGVILQETEDKKLAFWGSIASSLVAGYIKETSDKNSGYYFDNRDLLATTLGGLSVGVTFDIFTRKGKKKGRIFNINFK